jgi:hypothetical protein
VVEPGLRVEPAWFAQVASARGAHSCGPCASIRVEAACAAHVEAVAVPPPWFLVPRRPASCASASACSPSSVCSPASASARSAVATAAASRAFAWAWWAASAARAAASSVWAMRATRSTAAARSGAASSRLAAAGAAARVLGVVERLEEEDEEWRDMTTDWDG